MKRCLIVQTAFLGDVILATPIAEAIHRLHPGVEVNMLVRKGHEPLLARHAFIQQVLSWDKTQPKHRELPKLIKHIRRQAYDEVINVQRFGATGILTVFSGARQTTGFRKNPLSWLFSRAVPHQLGGKAPPHEVDRNLNLVSGWPKDKRLRPKLYPGKEDHDSVKIYQDGPYVVIAPASVWYTKQYPKAAWLAFLKASELRHYRIYLVGSPADKALCAHIQSDAEHPAVSNLAGELTLLQTAALMAGAQMTYCNDSAPLHLASAMNAPVAGIFCSTIPAFGFGPLSADSHVIEAPTTLKCRPCTNHGKPMCPRGHFRCAFDITPKQLLAPLHSEA